MESDAIINRMNISHYQALLQTKLDERRREEVRNLLAELKEHLMLQQESTPV